MRFIEIPNAAPEQPVLDLWRTSEIITIGSTNRGLRWFGLLRGLRGSGRCEEPRRPVVSGRLGLDAEKLAADLHRVPSVDEGVDHQVILFGPDGSPNSVAAMRKISITASSCRIRLFAFDNCADSVVMIPG